MLQFVETSIVRSLILVLALAVFCISAVLFEQTQGLKSRVTIGGLKGIPAVRAKIKKNSFFDRLNSEDKTRFVRHVNFVTKLIKQRNASMPTLARTAFLITLESFKAQVDPIFAAAVIAAESNFNPSAISPVGARGLMQVMPPTGAYVSEVSQFRWRGRASLYDTETNLQLGLRYIRKLYADYNGDLQSLLMAYNWGPGNLQRYQRGKAKLPKETRDYVAKVLRLYEQWQGDFQKSQNAGRVQLASAPLLTY